MTVVDPNCPHCGKPPGMCLCMPLSGRMSISEGLRYNTGKPDLFYCFLGKEVLEGEARVWEWGAKKYAPGNWLKGMSWIKSISSLLRHVLALLMGEDLDPETGLPHVDHIVCCAKIISNSYHTRKDLDDRPSSILAKEKAK